MIKHASRGPVRGPFCELDTGLMALMLDLALMLSSDKKGDLYLAVCEAVSGDSEIYWQSLLNSR